jgi:hypothetical protein
MSMREVVGPHGRSRGGRVVTDGGVEDADEPVPCGRRTCDADSDVSYVTAKGQVRVRCDAHALADGVEGVGEGRAETLLAEHSLRDLVYLVEGHDGGQAPVALTRLDGFGPTSASAVAKAINDSPVARAIRSADEHASVDVDRGEGPATDGGVVEPEERTVTLWSYCPDCDRLLHPDGNAGHERPSDHLLRAHGEVLEDLDADDDRVPEWDRRAAP